jgi:hypothetical protein
MIMGELLFLHPLQIETHIHCFRKTNMENLARICGLKVTKIIGSYIFIPIFNLAIPTNQTIYSDVIIYKLEMI